MTDSSLPPFVDVGTLRAMVSVTNPAVVLCDCRSYLDDRRGIDAFLAGHIPGARFVDLETVVSGPIEIGSGKGRHPLPQPETFADALGSLGIGPDDSVVAYDDVGGAIASRFVWMLRTIGQNAAVLDGGIAAWGEPLEVGEAVVEPVDRQPVHWPAGRLADADEVARVIEHGGLVVDSRGADRYAGRVEPIDPVAGHIPGAINLPFAENLDDGSLRSNGDLAHRFAAAGVDEQTIFYCGSGVTACHNLLAAEAAGLGRGRLYVGSWSGWLDREHPPIETSIDSAG